ncbi:hypothetical protein PENANT_c001G05939 [Penicillium antarcticum]|uniref:Uncharacterized protein n=1 Tax=Penicillium antarcticum TaxID=416450 RepID=A0A1V6QQ20_9EURO|nr:hypothetical protein PENANT_c001G05939 [Penicillium antarcticum]
MLGLGPPKFGYFVTHSSYTGITDLNDQGRLRLKSAQSCFEQNAPLELRLLASITQVEEAWRGDLVVRFEYALDLWTSGCGNMSRVSCEW